MKILKTLNFALLVLMVMCGMHCKQEPEVVYVSQETKDYFVFPVGSYWVYKNDSLGITDTMSVVFFDSTIDDIDNFEYHRYYIRKASSFWGLTEDQEIHNHSVFFSARFFYDPGSWIEIYHTPGFASSGSVFIGAGQAIIRGIQYPVVRHFTEPLSTGDTLDFWYAEGIGTVKYQVLGTDTIYELESYHINN